MVRAPARVEDLVVQTFGVETILPTQFTRGRAASPGPTALCAAILVSALQDAGLVPSRPAPPRTATAYARQAARRDDRRRTVAIAWLLGELEHQVDVPREVVCAALHIEPDALADVVRRRDGTNGRHERA